MFKNKADGSFNEEKQISLRDLLLADSILLKNENDELLEQKSWPQNFKFPIAIKQVIYMTTEAIKYD